LAENSEGYFLFLSLIIISASAEFIRARFFHFFGRFSGGFGTVIEGISKQTGEKVALKKISAAQFIHNPHNQRVCENEIHILRKVFHEFMNIYLPSLPTLSLQLQSNILNFNYV
jgi:hypothetical protein